MATTYGLSAVSAGTGQEQQHLSMVSSHFHNAPSRKRSRAYFDYETDSHANGHTPTTVSRCENATIAEKPVKRLQSLLAPRSSEETDSKGNINSNSVPVLLGVSWQVLPSHDDPENAHDSKLASAVRGWERFIENHFLCLDQAKIFLEHKGHNIYVVLGSKPGTRLKVRDIDFESELMFQGGNDYSHFPDPENQPVKKSSFDPADERDAQFYLFTSDLSQASLIADDWETCVKKISSGDFSSNTGPIVASRGPTFAAQSASHGVPAIQPNVHDSKSATIETPRPISEHGSMEIDS